MYKLSTKHLSPLETIRAYCLSCVGGIDSEVRNCTANKPGYDICPFHKYRMKTGRPSVKVIRKFCLQCMGDQANLVRECSTAYCLCHPYRMGTNPARIGKGYFADQAKLKIKPYQAYEQGFCVVESTISTVEG